VRRRSAAGPDNYRLSVNLPFAIEPPHDWLVMPPPDIIPDMPIARETAHKASPRDLIHLSYREMIAGRAFALAGDYSWVAFAG